MLNHMLKYLASGNTTIKVENPTQYNFKPRELLCEVLDCYMNLSLQPRFPMAVVSDERSYQRQMFENASSVLRSKALRDQVAFSFPVCFPSNVSFTPQEYIDQFESFVRHSLFASEDYAGIVKKYFESVPDELQGSMAISLIACDLLDF